MLALLLQTWKAQPVFLSVVSDSCGELLGHRVLPAVRCAVSNGRGLNVASVRCLASGNGSAGRGGASSSAPEQPSASLWTRLQRVVFPVDSASSSIPAASATSPSAASTSRPGHSSISSAQSRSSARPALSPTAARAIREAGAAQRRAERGREDAFAAISKPAERFSGTLLKVAVVIVTVPLGVHMMSNSLLVSLCVKGLESDRPETVALTLRRLRSVVGSDFLAARFEEADGVALLLAAFNARAEEAVLREFLPAVQQLLRFPATREALLMSSLVERLESALSSGWLPAELREEARQLYLDAHAARRMGSEAAAA